MNDSGLTVRTIPPSQQEGRILKPGDLLLEKSGGGEQQTVGTVVLFDLPLTAVCCNFIARMRIAEGHDSPYLNYLHTALYAARLNTRSIKQTTGIQNLDQHQYLSEYVAIPPLPEQHSIADYLDRKTAQIDQLIRAKQKQIELLQEQRTALVSRAVTKGLDPNVPMKDSEIEWIGEIPAHWGVRRLGWIADAIADIDHNMPRAVEEGIAFLSAKDLLDDGTLNFDRDVKRISREDFQRLSRKIRPKRNDIIYSRIGARLGKARLVKTDLTFLVSYSCCVIRVLEAVAIPAYVCHVLDSEWVLTEARLRTIGIGVPDLGLGEIAKFPIPLPPLAEQRRILSFLDENLTGIANVTVSLNQSVVALQEYRSALISEVVTGKIDVRGLAD